MRKCFCFMICLAAGAASAQSANNEFDCLIEARQQVDVRASAEGVIESVLVRRGDKVKKGELLAKLSSGPEQATVNLSRSRAGMEGEIKAAQARVDLAKKKWERADELAKRNFVSANAKDEAEAELRLANEQFHALQESRQLAELELKRAEEVLAQRSVHSPVNGVVVALLLKPGELASSNQKDPILKVSEIDPLHVELVLPVKEYGKIKRGQSARIFPEQPIGGSYQAKVDVVDLTVDAASGTFGVRLLLPNPGNRIPAGVKCRAKF
ncbi:MAG TPA: efflux RND transporter periplasmic adaptor subunit [Burkholderiales bacterium]|jgi:RND family efflux transporter MFP subunit|nr:efflux RND transporter periplasmic adaptor subunit [Burkholderiales bacterium]